MIKIWAKIIQNNKIVKQYVYENKNKFNDKHFLNYLIEICKELDLQTPILLNNHIINFLEFHSVKFFPSDFLEECSFDYFLIEDISL